MAFTYRVMTLNINGLASHTRHQMLEDFLRRHDVDFALLQEVTSLNPMTFKGYQTIDNIGISGRGTAIIAKEDLQMHMIRRLPSGRGLVAYYNNIFLLNKYAPSGSANRAERETFYNSEVIELLLQVPTSLIMAGDFNWWKQKTTAQGTDIAVELWKDF